MQTFLFNKLYYFRKEDVLIYLGRMKIFDTSFLAKKQTLLKENEYNYYETTLQISANSKSLAVVGFEPTPSK